MQTADYDHKVFSNTAEADKSLLVRFFEKSVENKLESQAQGRPIFKDKVYIEIRVAGQRDPQACRPVTHADKQRFPDHWSAYEKRTAPPSEGTPLLEWGLIARSQAEELAFLNIKTVEQLAVVIDTNLQNFRGGYELRERAKKWLEKSALETEDTEKQEMRDRIAELEAKIEALAASKPSRPTNEGKEADSVNELTSELDEPQRKPRTRRKTEG
jgi:hypothetical protein